MGWVDTLKGKIVGLDTAPLIYYIEEHPDYIDTVAPFFEALQQRELRVITSTVTLMEVLVAPIKRGNIELATKYRTVFSNVRDLSLMVVTKSLAERAAYVRAAHNLFTPDVIQIAAALSANADFFLTNDKHFASIPGISVLLLDNLKAQSLADKPETDS